MSEKLNIIYGVFTIVFGIVILIGCTSFGYDAYQSYTETQNEIKNSVQTTGQIIDNDIQKEVIKTEDGTRTEYVFSTKYEYQVNNNRYTSESLQPAYDTKAFASRSSANEYKDKYSIASQVTVNYLPSNPKESYLESTGGAGGPIITILFAGIFGIAAIYTIRTGLRTCLNYK